MLVIKNYNKPPPKSRKRKNILKLVLSREVETDVFKPQMSLSKVS